MRFQIYVWQLETDRQTDRHIVIEILSSPARDGVIGNESIPKIITNDTTFFHKLQSAFWYNQTITVSVLRLIKLLPYASVEKHFNILALEMASPRNRHRANCIGAL